VADLEIDAVDGMDTACTTAKQSALERKLLGQVPDPEQRLIL
jgi:hypothetical protein